MAALGRSTLKRYFETGKGLSNRAFVDTVDSIPSVVDTTVQTFNAALSFPDLTITGTMSAGSFYVAGNFTASAATFPGRLTQGGSGSTGIPVVYQESTVAATATSRVATLPPNSNIVGLGVKVLSASSGAGGGTTINAGDGSAIDFFGSITVSAVGSYQFTDVSARRLASVSGAVWMSGITATAGANFIGNVQYYQGTIMTVAVTYAAWNPNDAGAGATFADNNRTATTAQNQGIRSTGSKSSGKWYVEFTMGADITGSTGPVLGVASSSVNIATAHHAQAATGWAYIGDGRKMNNGSLANYGTSYTNGDVVMMALDMDNGKIWFGKNGTWQASGDPVAGTNAAYTGLSGSLMCAWSSASGSRTTTGNWGASAFVYTAPTGFSAWSIS